MEKGKKANVRVYEICNNIFTVSDVLGPKPRRENRCLTSGEQSDRGESYFCKMTTQIDVLWRSFQTDEKTQTSVKQKPLFISTIGRSKLIY